MNRFALLQTNNQKKLKKNDYAVYSEGPLSPLAPLVKQSAWKGNFKIVSRISSLARVQAKQPLVTVGISCNLHHSPDVFLSGVAKIPLPRAHLTRSHKFSCKSRNIESSKLSDIDNWTLKKLIHK
jgi:hypothetical protein